MDRRAFTFGLVVACCWSLCPPRLRRFIPAVGNAHADRAERAHGTTGTLLASLAVAAVGVLALAGRVSWSFAGSVLFGIACLFGCVRIVAIFNG